jgi:transaldolase / glucose-6-phosphate isomerase
MTATGKPNQQAIAGENPLKQLLRFGQSVWLDYIRRDLISSGELARLIQEDGLRGMTSNPTIFEKAIAHSPDYLPALEQLTQRKDLDAKGVYEQIAIRDIQDAADVLRPVYEQSERRDGYVSLEVSPYLAHQTRETIDEARRLWKTVARQNIMIKVPGTEEGIPAIRELLGGGINVNVTLLFARDVYQRVAETYVAGLEDHRSHGGDPSRLASVASFFVSRIDTLVDNKIGELLKNPPTGLDANLARSLQGKVAIANAKLAYETYKKVFSGPRWQALVDRGAVTQRVLWASTGTKNPAYSDVLYVDELIGPDTVNTMPPATLEAFRDHGKPRASLEEGVEAAKKTMADLARAGISMKAVTDQLTEDGVKLFADAFDQLLTVVEQRVKHVATTASR